MLGTILEAYPIQQVESFGNFSEVVKYDWWPYYTNTKPVNTRMKLISVNYGADNRRINIIKLKLKDLNANYIVKKVHY